MRKPHFNTYTRKNPPKRETARKIWRAFEEKDNIEIFELWYNPNCWGRSRNIGWGTWAGNFQIGNHQPEDWFCGVYEGRIYIQPITAPFQIYFLDEFK